MYTPKFSTKRALGVVLAAALAVGGTAALASNSEAAVTNPVATLKPNTGPVGGGATVTVTGKGFMDSTLAVQVKTVKFNTAACTVDATVAASGTNVFVPIAGVNVVSATKVVFTTPAALTAGVWYLCLWDGTTASSNILGQATFTTAAGPTATTIASAVANVATASQLGGTSVALSGTNFDKSFKASIDNLPAKTTFVSSTKLQIVLPAHSVATALKIKVEGTYGSATSTDTVTYARAIASVTPAFGTGTVLDVITVKGVGFLGRTFTSTPALGNSEIALIKGGYVTTPGVGAAPLAGTASLCGSVQVESDSVLTCSLTAAVADGAYSVVIFDEGAAGTAIASVTAVSKAATYTVSDF
jgi:hypothetical protein